MIVAWRLLQPELRYEVWILVLEQAADKVEEAPDEVRDDHGQEDQSEHAVDVLHDEGEDDLLAARLVAEQRLHQLVDTIHLKEREYALDPYETHELDNDSDLRTAAVFVDLARIFVISTDQVKRHCRDDLKEEASAHDVLLRYGRVADLAAFLAIIRQSEEPEDDIEREKGRDHVLCEVDDIVANVEFDGGEVHRRKTTVNDDCQHDTVPERQERASWHKLHLLLAARLLLLIIVRLLGGAGTRCHCSTALC